jgi:hypothetical protein
MMNTARRFATILSAALVMVAATTADAVPVYQWKKRALVVFSPSAGDARLARQKTIVGGNRTAFLDRDVVVVYVVGGDVMHDLGPPPGMSASALRSLYRASEGAFRVLLVGKDGGVKIDSPVPPAAADLFAEIDRMPMRRDEMKKRSTERP